MTDLPPLPEPKLYPAGTYPDGVLTYSADQMRDYARAAVLAERARIVAAASAKGWGIKDDSPFEESVRQIVEDA